MPPLNVLHLASFTGNIGDNAMHDGEYRTRAEDLPWPLRHRPCEVRSFIHWRERAFDDTFVEEANAADLLVIGGFSLFQLWREETASGTYLDVAPELFGRVRVPVIFHGLGCDATRGVSPLAVARSRAFLDAMADHAHCRFSLRNDGAADLIAATLGAPYAARMPVIPDGGLFADPPAFAHPGLPSGTRYLAVNLAGDMPDKRYAGTEGADAAPRFAAALADGLERILAREPALRCVFVPHIHSDLAPISAVLDRLDDRIRRERVIVAACAQGDSGWGPAFDLYRNAAAVIAMRYHAALASMGFATPVLGLSTHHKIEGQFAALGLADRCLTWRDGVPMEPLFAQLAADLADATAIRVRLARIRADERQRLKSHHEDLARWLVATARLPEPD